MKKYAKRDREVNTLMYEAILSLKDVDEAIRFFDDLCSITELRAIEQRFQVAKLLSEGHIYNAILDETGASSATISRVNRSLQYGAGGYDIVLNRIKKDEL
jgi:TrpR-related protein YerC/YecD